MNLVGIRVFIRATSTPGKYMIGGVIVGEQSLELPEESVVGGVVAVSQGNLRIDVDLEKLVSIKTAAAGLRLGQVMTSAMFASPLNHADSEDE